MDLLLILSIIIGSIIFVFIYFRQILKRIDKDREELFPQIYDLNKDE